MSWTHAVLIGFDQLLNTLCGGWPDETLSARCWRKRHHGRGWSAARRLIDALFFWDAGHCEQSWESEINRTQAPPEAR